MAAPSPDTSRWLDDDEMAFWRTFIEVSITVMARIEADLKRDAGFGFNDYEVLVHLSEADGRRLRMSELSKKALHSRSRLTQRVDRMVARGLVQREKCSADGRGTFAVLTDAGFAEISAAAPLHLASVRSTLIDRLSREQLRFGLDTMNQLVASTEHDVAID